MEKKFILTEKTCVIDGRTLYRIRAEKNFSDVRKGEFGGFVEREANLSHSGNSWIYDDAYVYDNGYVYNDARIRDFARIYDNARIHDNACICNEAHVYNNAQVYNSAYVRGDVHVYDNARIFNNAHVAGHARIYNNACVYRNAFISGNAHIFENAQVCGDANIYGDARIGEHTKVQFSRLKTDLKEDLKASLRCQCNLISENGKVIAYKLVCKNLHSLYDNKFVYKIGEFAVCKDPKEDNSSCSAGLHFSNLTYWDNRCGECLEDLVYLKAEIDLKDIITIQEGKIRCRKAKILSKIEIE